MNEYVNKATNEKVIAVQWLGSFKSTIQINPDTLFSYNKNYDPNEYLSHSIKTLDIMKNKSLDGIAYTQVPVNAYIGDYIIVGVKDILSHTLIDYGDDCRTEINKPDIFKEWYRKVPSKSTNNIFLVENSHSNNMFRVPDPVNVLGASNDICRAYQHAVKKYIFTVNQEFLNENRFLNR